MVDVARLAKVSLGMSTGSVTAIARLSESYFVVGTSHGTLHVVYLSNREGWNGDLIVTCPCEIQESVRKVQYSASVGRLFVQVDSNLYAYGWDGTQLSLGLLIGTEVVSFDLIAQGRLTALLAVASSALTIFKCVGGGLDKQLELPIEETMEECLWIKTSLLCLIFAGKRYKFFKWEHNTFATVGTNTFFGRPVAFSSLCDSREYDEVKQVSHRVGQVAVLVLSPLKVYFPYFVVVFGFAQRTAEPFEIERFSVLVRENVTFFTNYGPWLLVGQPSGLDFYLWKDGSHFQSVCDGQLCERVSCSSRTIGEGTIHTTVYNSETTEIVIADGQAFKICFFPLIKVVTQLLGEMEEQGGYGAQLLMQYGHSVGCVKLMCSSPYTTRSRATSFAHNKKSMTKEFAAVLNSFRLLDPTPGNDEMSVASKPDKCTSCRASFGLLKKVKFCRICFLAFCEKCTKSIELFEWGYLDETENGIVCKTCLGFCDANLFALLHGRRFSDAVTYLREHPERCRGFEESELLSVLLDQCVWEGRYDLCAKLLVEEETLNPQRIAWEHWLFKFSSCGATLALARCLAKTDADVWVNTTVLSQLCKYNPAELRTLISHFTTKQYEPRSVAGCIEELILAKQRDALQEQKDCETTSVDPAFRRCAVGQLYFDRVLTDMLQVAIFVYDAMGLYCEVVRVFVQHFIDFLPTAQWMEENRPRSWEVAQAQETMRLYGSLPVGNKKQHWRPWTFFDVWQYIVEHNLGDMLLLPEERPKGSPYQGPSLLQSLVLHDCARLVEYMIKLVKSQGNSMIDSFVAQLMSLPEALIRFLDTLNTSTGSFTATEKYHALQAELYLDYAPSKLMPFLRSSEVNNVNWKKMLVIAQKKRLYSEVVYIHGRMGNDREAIRVAVRCLRHVGFAMDYIDNSKDQTLWGELIHHVVQNEDLIAQFLENLPGRYDPAEFLKKIPNRNRLVIPDITKHLLTAVAGTRIDQDVMKAALWALDLDDSFLQHRFVQHSRKALVAKNYGYCDLCRGEIKGDFVLAGCGHCYHKKCICEEFETKLRRHSTTNVQRAVEIEWKDVDDEYAFTNLEVLRESGAKDLVELLPKSVFFVIVSYLAITEKRRLLRVNKRWCSITRELIVGGIVPGATSAFEEMHRKELQYGESVRTITTKKLPYFGEQCFENPNVACVACKAMGKYVM